MIRHFNDLIIRIGFCETAIIKNIMSMKKFYVLILFFMWLSIPAAAQHYVYGIYGKMVNVAGNNRYVVTAVDPYGPAFSAGIRPTDIILSVDGKNCTDETSLTDKKSGVFKVVQLGGRVGDIKIDGQQVDAEHAARECDFAQYAYEGDVLNYSTRKVLDMEPISVQCDPDVFMYGYKSFDFDFNGDNTLAQKEIAAVIGPIMEKKGLQRDTVKPALVILISFYSDRRDHYVPPTQSISTTYRYGYEYGDGWGTRQYINTQTYGDYTATEYLTRMSITMLDGEKLRNGKSQAAAVWGAQYETLYSKKAIIKDFASNIGYEMLSCFPIKQVGRVDFHFYYGIGVIFDADKKGRVAGVYPNSPAAEAGVKTGDILSMPFEMPEYNKVWDKLKSQSENAYLYQYSNFALDRESRLKGKRDNYTSSLSKYYLSFWNFDKMGPKGLKLRGERASGEKYSVIVHPERKCFEMYMIYK